MRQAGVRVYFFLGVTAVLWVSSLQGLSRAQEARGPLDLQAAFGLALKTHESILVAERELVKSGLLPKKANAIMLPRLALEGTYNRLDDPIEYEAQVGDLLTLPPIQTIPEEQWVGNFNFTQPIYEGVFFPSKRKAKQTITGTTEDYYRVIQDVLFRVAQAYYEVFKARELVSNAREILGLTQEELRVSKVRFEAGDATEDVVLRSELNVSRAENQVIESTNRLKLTREILKRLIGMERQDPDLDLVEPPKNAREPIGFEDLVKRALDTRHDYKMALVNVDLAATDIDLVKARFHPSLKGSWDYYRVDQPSFYQRDDYWVASVKLHIPLFEGGYRFVDLKEKKESLRQAQLTLEGAEDVIRLEVEEAFLTEETDRSVLDKVVKEEVLAKKYYEIVFSKFKFGAATTLELEQALSALATAKADLTNRKYDYQIALLRLEKSTGVFAAEYIRQNVSPNP